MMDSAPYPLIAYAAMKQHALRIPDELWDRVEEDREMIPRNPWLVLAIEYALTVSTAERQRTLESALGGAEESEHLPSDRSVAAPARTPGRRTPESASPVPRPRASTPSTASRQGRPSPAASSRAPESDAMARQRKLNAAKAKRG